MAGVAQSTYLMPKERIGAFLRDAEEAGLLEPGVGAKEKDEELLYVLLTSKDGFYPTLSLWAVKEAESLRRIDLLWLRGQEQSAEKIDLLARKQQARCEALIR